jgi:5-(carboxyamino)imidazole ribonucleotide mutase
MVASMSPLPVIGVPVKSSNSIDGWDSIYQFYKCLEESRGDCSIEWGQNAGILAAQIIGSHDKGVLNKVIQYKLGTKESVIIALKVFLSNN